MHSIPLNFKPAMLLSLVATLFFLTACTGDGDSGDQKDKADVIIETNLGDIKVKLYDDTPKHKENFLKLVKDGFYDNTTFHRVIEGFMVQGGDPNTAKEDFVGQPGMGGPGYTIANEINSEHLHKRGALAAARQGDQVNPLRESSGSQFFIVQGESYDGREQELTMVEQHLNQARFDGFAAKTLQDEQYQGRIQEIRELSESDTNMANEKSNALMQELQKQYEAQYPEPFQYTAEQKQVYTTQGGTPHLDLQYTVFGEVVDGMEVVDKIAAAEKGPNDQPKEPIRMTVKVVE